MEIRNLELLLFITAIIFLLQEVVCFLLILRIYYISTKLNKLSDLDYDNEDLE